MRTAPLSIVIVTVMLAASCHRGTRVSEPPRRIVSRERDANLILCVRNMSWNRHDANVRIDGVSVAQIRLPAMRFSLRREGEGFREFPRRVLLRVPEGVHNLEIELAGTGTKLEREFELKGRSWALVIYSEEAGFWFAISDQPIRPLVL